MDLGLYHLLESQRVGSKYSVVSGNVYSIAPSIGINDKHRQSLHSRATISYIILVHCTRLSPPLPSTDERVVCIDDDDNDDIPSLLSPS
jgi:hypothetical protein